MKIVRFDRLLASTAIGLAMMLTSLTGAPRLAAAQQSEKPAEATVAIPNIASTVPAAAKDAVSVATPAPLLDTAKDANKEAAKDAAVAAVPVSADSAIADKLRETITGKQFDRTVSRKADRAGIEQFYSARNYAPIWVSNGAANERAKSVIATLNQADTAGLDPSEYPTPDFKSATSPEALAEAELKLTAAALTYARHAQAGRVHYTRVAGDISFTPLVPEPADVLTKLAADNDAGKTLDAFNPPQAEFKALRVKLAELRKNGGLTAAKAEAKAPAPVVRIADGKILREGMSDARVVSLRQRLNISSDKDSPRYDAAVTEAVKIFQTEADIGVDGNVGPQTLRALNGEKPVVRGPSHDPIDTLIVNMERWRWFPRELGNQHVIVNVPDYRLTLYNGDKVYWTTKIVVGKPVHATPMISAEMKFITVNPTWNVPPSIIENEYLPALQQDPDALDRIGLKLEQAADGTVRIYQPPGAANALGRIRFNFPNKYLVYQHDTPDKHLFKKEARAYSHGCMRVENPLVYGEKLLSLVLPNENYTAARLEKMFGGSEININFPKNIWVHLTYQTAFVDEDGKLQLRDDVYGRDGRMIAIMKGSDRRVADIAIERAPDSSSKPVRMPVGMYSGGYNSGPNFFEMLFGGGQQMQQVQQPDRRRNFIGPRYNNNGRISSR